jgi:Ca2+-binding EF-hand superfamily protein
MTKVKLLQKRKAESIPHITFDLDGDGYVGGRDLVMAKHFDKDGDGKLNEIERENAMKALAEGYEDKFVWGIE